MRQSRDNFYPRSPCGERPIFAVRPYDAPIFLSTLSLRRATLAMAGYTKAEIISIHALLAESDLVLITQKSATIYFYPRSPCGERPRHPAIGVNLNDISIHALLAESDVKSFMRNGFFLISIHALLAESDDQLKRRFRRANAFLSTLSLRRATYQH